MFVIVTFGDKTKVSKTYDPHIEKNRGNIYDRNGALVATDIRTKSLYASSILIRNPKDIATGLSKIFPDLSYKEVYSKISFKRDSSRSWILLKRNLTPDQVEKVQSLQKAGLVFEDDMARVYPQKSNLSHVVGFVDLDRRGLSGIEMQYNEILRKDEDINLTIDVRVQDILRSELLKGMDEFQAKAASGIIMNVRNGEVLALTSLPDFDPNQQSSSSPKERFNRTTSGVYEMGSIFKIFTNAIALEEGLVEFSDVFDVSKPIEYGKYTIRDDHKEKDQLTLQEVFGYSSNIGTVQIAQRIGIEKQKSYLKKFGLIDKIKTDFPGLAKPISPRKWREINLYTIAYGHGIAVTPLHVASSISSVVNGGFLHSPKFILDDDQFSLKPKKILSDATSVKLRRLMEFTVEKGTGKNAQVLGYQIGGKTGTAERAEYGGYNKKQTLVSFVAVFPIKKPKYLVFVTLDRPNYTFNTGGMVAAPVAGRITEKIAPLLGVRPKL
ncbi:MAG: penicillin-binding protein 2 [Rickettsiales bacterium]|nr:penicillin-binding protein 2 [Rickettsiales bacterium]